LTTQIKGQEESESSSSGEYTYDDDSEGDFRPAKEGTPITTTTQPKSKRKIQNTEEHIDKQDNEARIFRIVKFR